MQRKQAGDEGAGSSDGCRGWPLLKQPLRRDVAPTPIARNFSHTISSATSPSPADVSKPQSVRDHPARIPSRPHCALDPIRNHLRMLHIISLGIDNPVTKLICAGNGLSLKHRYSC